MDGIQTVPGTTPAEFNGLFVVGHKTVSWANYIGSLSKTDLGVSDPTEYTWIIFNSTWENMVKISSVTTNAIEMRAWVKTTPAAQDVSLKQTGDLIIYWTGIKIGQAFQ
jgi:hypothetical protein